MNKQNALKLKKEKLKNAGKDKKVITLHNISLSRSCKNF